MTLLSDKIDKDIRFNLAARVHKAKADEQAKANEEGVKLTHDELKEIEAALAICPLDFFIDHADAYIFRNAKDERQDCYFQGVVDVGVIARNMRAKRTSVAHECNCGNHLRGALAKKIRASRNDMDDAWLFVLNLVRRVIKENPDIIAKSRMTGETHNFFNFMQNKIYSMRNENLSKDL